MKAVVRKSGYHCRSLDFAKQTGLLGTSKRRTIALMIYHLSDHRHSPPIFVHYDILHSRPDCWEGPRNAINGSREKELMLESTANTATLVLCKSFPYLEEPHDARWSFKTVCSSLMRAGSTSLTWYLRRECSQDPLLAIIQSTFSMP